MATSFVVENLCPSGTLCEIAFAGDGVRLAGQLDYPRTPLEAGGKYPLLFTIQHTGYRSRSDYNHYAQAALNAGYAVFRWDKRGTGRSGAGGRGSTTQDAVYAYEAALAQPNIDHTHVIILAQGEGTKLLGSAFGLFARMQAPIGVILVSNMLDEQTIQAINAPVQIIQGDRDWHTPDRFAVAAAESHRSAYAHGADVYIAEGADRLLTVGSNGTQAIHFGAVHAIQDWLEAR